MFGVTEPTTQHKIKNRRFGNTEHLNIKGEQQFIWKQIC